MPLRNGRQNFSRLLRGAIFSAAAASCAGVVVTEVASFVKMPPWRRALAASELVGENMKTFGGRAGRLEDMIDGVGNTQRMYNNDLKVKYYSVLIQHRWQLSACAPRDENFKVNIVMLQPTVKCFQHAANSDHQCLT